MFDKIETIRTRRRLVLLFIWAEFDAPFSPGLNSAGSVSVLDSVRYASDGLCLFQFHPLFEIHFSYITKEQGAELSM